MNPTAEQIAALVFERLEERIGDERLHVQRVEVWETPRSSAAVER